MMEATQQIAPLSILSLLNSNKSQRKSFCRQIIEQMENGEADPLQVHVFLKNLEQIFKTLTDEKIGKDFAERYKVQLMAAAEKEDGSAFEKYNAAFQIKEAGTKYDYSVCKDLIHEGLRLQKEGIDMQLKEREKFLQAIPESGMVITDEETGETKKIYRPAKSSTTTLSVTLS